MEFVKKWIEVGQDYSDALDVRINVFVNEQGFTMEEECDDLDAKCPQLVIYNDEMVPVATGRLIKDGDDYHLGRIAVKKEFRGHKLGAILVNDLKDRAISQGAKNILLGAQFDKVGFYEKCGFEVCDSVPYLDGYMKHFRMKLKG